MSTSTSTRNRTLPIILAIGGVLIVCLCLLGALGLGGYWFYSQGQTAGADPAVIYILDASPRMSLGFEGSTRLEVAGAVLAEVVRPALPTVKAGLRLFGSGAVAEACSDTELRVPLAPATQSQIADTAFGLTANVSSEPALGEAMLAAIKDLSAAAGPHTLVVITGGPDTCNAAAGELIKQEAERAGITLQEFVIGLGVTPEESLAIKGYIEAAVGTYLDAPDASTLRNILLAIQAYIDQPASTSLAAIQAAATPGAVVVIPTAPVAATTAASTPGGHQPQTACDHPYFPMRPGSTWTYSGTVSTTVMTVESVTGDLVNAAAEVTEVYPDFSIARHYTCTSEGVRLLTSYEVTAGGQTTATTVSDQTGVSLPNLEVLVPGAAWTATGVNTIESGTPTTVSHSFTAGPLQTLETAAGSFEVIVITSNQTATNAGFTAASNLTAYYAHGVGLVRRDGSFNAQSDFAELTSYSIP